MSIDRKFRKIHRHIVNNVMFRLKFGVREDPYVVLGVPRNATERQIRTAYYNRMHQMLTEEGKGGDPSESSVKQRKRELLREKHPDHNHSPSAGEDFIRVNEQLKRLENAYKQLETRFFPQLQALEDYVASVPVVSSLVRYEQKETGLTVYNVVTSIVAYVVNLVMFVFAPAILQAYLMRSVHKATVSLSIITFGLRVYQMMKRPTQRTTQRAYESLVLVSSALFVEMIMRNYERDITFIKNNLPMVIMKKAAEIRTSLTTDLIGEFQFDLTTTGGDSVSNAVDLVSKNIYTVFKLYHFISYLKGVFGATGFMEEPIKQLTDNANTFVGNQFYLQAATTPTSAHALVTDSLNPFLTSFLKNQASVLSRLQESSIDSPRYVSDLVHAPTDETRALALIKNTVFSALVPWSTRPGSVTREDATKVGKHVATSIFGRYDYQPQLSDNEDFAKILLGAANIAGISANTLQTVYEKSGKPVHETIVPKLIEIVSHGIRDAIIDLGQEIVKTELYKEVSTGIYIQMIKYAIIVYLGAIVAVWIDLYVGKQWIDKIFTIFEDFVSGDERIPITDRRGPTMRSDLRTLPTTPTAPTTAAETGLLTGGRGSSVEDDRVTVMGLLTDIVQTGEQAVSSAAGAVGQAASSAAEVVGGRGGRKGQEEISQSPSATAPEEASRTLRRSARLKTRFGKRYYMRRLALS